MAERRPDPLKIRIKELEAELQDLDELLEVRTNELEKTRQEKAELQRFLVRKPESEKLEHANAQEVKINRLLRRTEELEGALKHSGEALQSMSYKVTALEKENGELRADIKQRGGPLNGLVHREWYEKLKETNKQLNEQLETRTKERLSVGRALDEMRSEKLKLQKENEELRFSTLGLGATATEEMEKVHELQKQVAELQQENTKLKAKAGFLQGRQKSLEEKAKESGLVLARADYKLCYLELRTVLINLLRSLPACDLCIEPATKAWARGRGRWCLKHAPEHCPDYPRASPIGRALLLLEHHPPFAEEETKE